MIRFIVSTIQAFINMKVIFNTDFDETASGSNENEKERIQKVRISFNEDDLIERRYVFDTFLNFMKSNRIKLSG